MYLSWDILGSVTSWDIQDIPSVFVYFGIPGYVGISHQKCGIQGYPKLCKCLQSYTGITQDNLVADAACRVLALLISSTPCPSLLQAGNLPT